MSIVCDTGFINIVDPFLNPDSTVWTGSITYTLQYATTVAGATLVEARQVINVSDGIDICLAPGLYTVVYNQSGQRLPVTSQWTVPPTGGPYTIADLEGVGPVTGSLTVTGPFIAMSTVTMTSLINAAARPYVATDSVGLLSTGNLALIAISGSASDLASGTVAATRGGAGTLSGLLKANGAGVVSAAVAGTDYAVATNGTNAQFLTSNGAGGFGTAVSSTGSGSVVLATSPSLTTPDLGTPSTLVLTNATGLPAAAMPGLTGDVTSSAGSVATTVVKINGTTLATLATGILKNTTTTGVPSIAVAGTDYAVATNGTIGQALTSNGTGGFSTALTLATVATSGSASDLGSGTLSAARLPALTGDATSSVGSAATTVVKINGIALSGLATGLLKNTTTTGVPSIAVAGTDYSVATNGTNGQALTSNGTGGFGTAVTLATVATSGSASDLTAGTLAAARGGAGTLSGILKANGVGVVSAAAAGTDYAVATNGTLGQVLTSNAAGGFSTALTLATVATSGSATDLSSGTLPAARMPAITGDVTTTVGTVATTVSKINGTTLSGLATGLLKNTTATGVPSIAVAGTDYAVATNGTIGQALTSNGTGGFSTALTLATVATSGSASDLTAGTLAAARMPALTGDVTTTVGTVAATVVKINGTTLSGLATGLLKNTTATGVPSIAVAGTDLIGGVGNLTTVGSVPYVSASGILNQDAGQFSWDATNNRLGIGTATPASALHVKSANNEILSDATTGDATISTAIAGVRKWSIYNQSAGNTLLFYDWTNSVSRLTVQPGTATAMTILASGNVGIGTATPLAALHVKKSGGGALPASGGTTPTGSAIFGTVNDSQKLYMGVDPASPYSAWLQVASEANLALTYPLLLNPNGGNVGIGTTAPASALDVTSAPLTTFPNNPITTTLISTTASAANMGAGIQFQGKWNSAGQSTTFAYIGGVKENSTDSNYDGKLVFGTRQNSSGANDMTRMTILASGNVGIGTTAPLYKLDVAKSGASGTARFYDQTATFGATRVVISLGAADTDSTQVFEIGGLMKFSGLNSTGAGTALLSTNSPAVTNTAPYTWFKVLTSDGSTGYIPVWK